MRVEKKRLVLLLEDEAIIANDVELSLGDFGLTDVVHQTTCEGAMKWLASNRPCLAIIDAWVKDGVTNEIATYLNQQSIPFIVHSAEARRCFKYIALEKHFTWFEKPCDPNALGEAAYRISCGT